MTKSKVVKKDGKVVRMNLHPTAEMLRSYSGLSCGTYMRSLKAQGHRLQNRSW